MAHHVQFAQYPSNQQPIALRKLLNQERVYILIENRSGADIRVCYDNQPDPNGFEGIQVTAGSKYELWYPFAPDNDVIYIAGSIGATQQQVNITQAFRAVGSA